MRFEIRMIAFITCSTRMTDTPSARICSTRAHAAFTSRGLSPPIGSSRSRSPGSVASARAISSRFCSPRVRSAASEPSLSCNPTRSRIWAASVSARRRAASWLKAARVTFSRTESLGKGLTTWKVLAMPRRVMAWGRSPTTLRPSSRIRPALGRRKPVTRLKAVVLPAPFGPMSPRISPGSTSKERRETARSPPKSLVRSVTVSKGMGVPSGPFRPGAAGAAPDALGQVPDDQHHEEPVEDQVADEEALAEHLADGREEHGTDHRADHGGEAADHRDEHHLHRERNGEDGVRVHVAEVQTVEAATQPGEEGGEREGEDLGTHGVDAHRLRRVLVLADGEEIGAEPRPGQAIGGEH